MTACFCHNTPSSVLDFCKFEKDLYYYRPSAANYFYFVLFDDRCFGISVEEKLNSDELMGRSISF